ncbi:MAG TPA: hypothetical protein VHG91_06710 [Longimicrobium sp.]|nr:hypothetical protein [Longimicrobium sp.]
MRTADPVLPQPLHRLGVPVFRGPAPASDDLAAVAERPQIVDNRTLQGFDMLVAITQKTLNDQMALLFAQGILPTSWEAAWDPSKPDLPPKISVQWGAPSVNLVTAVSANRIVEARFPMASGTLTYLEPDPNDPFRNIPREVDCAGWTLVFQVNMGLADIAATAPVVPPEVRKQLEEFSTEMFRIEHLFLNFEDANLITNSWRIEAPNGVPANAAFQTQFTVLLRRLIGLYQGSDNPYILGYSVTQTEGLARLALGYTLPEGARVSADDPADSPTFAPTGVSYSVFPERDRPDMSSLNFLLMTNHLPVPGGGAGLFEHNWATDPNVQGEMVFSQFLILGNVVTPLAAAIGASPSALTRELRIAARNKDGGETSCQVSFGDGTRDLYLDFRYTFDIDVEDHFGTGIGYVDGFVAWRTVLTYALDGDDRLTVSTRNEGYQQKYERHPNWIGKLESYLAIFADVATGAFLSGKGIFTELVSDDWNTKLDLRIDSAVADIRSRIILPAGNVYFFKDPRFNAAGDLRLALTYRN